MKLGLKMARVLEGEMPVHWDLDRLLKSRLVQSSDGKWYFHANDVWPEKNALDMQQFYANKHWAHWICLNDIAEEYWLNARAVQSLVEVGRNITREIRKQVNVITYCESVLFRVEDTDLRWVRLVPFMTMVNNLPFEKKVLRNRVLIGSEPNVTINTFLKDLQRHGKDPVWLAEFENTPTRQCIFFMKE
jgi:hypothetical protein